MPLHEHQFTLRLLLRDGHLGVRGAPGQGQQRGAEPECAKPRGFKPPGAAEAVRVAPGATVGVRLALVDQQRIGGGRVDWEVADLPRGWQARWEERGPGAARVRLVVARGAEAGVYPVVMAARLGDGRVVTRTVRLEVAPEAALPWATLAGFGALVGALTVGWIGVLAGIRGERARRWASRSSPAGAAGGDPPGDEADPA